MKSGLVYSSCKVDFPDLYFEVDGWGLQVSASDYVEDVSVDGDKSLCLIHIESLDAPFNILGLPIFQEYYVTHDYRNGTMDFAPHSASKKSAIKKAVSYETAFFSLTTATENTPNGELWAAAIAALLVIGGIAFWGYYVFVAFYDV